MTCNNYVMRMCVVLVTAGKISVALLLWTQLKNCLELMKNTDEGKMRAEELTKRRMILEERSDHLKEMKKRSKLKPWPVMNEQKEVEFKNIEQLLQAVNKLGYIPVDPSKCEVVIPPVIVKKTTTLMIMLKNKNANTDASKELNVFIENIRDGEAIQVGPIKEVGGGRYEASFTASRCGYYMISIIVDGHHIPGSPYK